MLHRNYELKLNFYEFLKLLEMPSTVLCSPLVENPYSHINILITYRASNHWWCSNISSTNLINSRHCHCFIIKVQVQF